MFLDIADSKSRFGEDAELIKDSTLYAASSGSGVGAFSMMGRVRPKLKTVVYKDSKNQSVITLENMGRYSFFYTENPKINWKIENETKKIGTLLCQKATTRLYGREWIAWFSKDFPFSEGPYKFNGLPGLIIEISDTKSYYTFQLIRNYKAEVLFSKDIILNAFRVSKKDFIEKKLQQIENPMANMQGISLGGDVLKVIKDKAKARALKENNPLELKPFE